MLLNTTDIIVHYRSSLARATRVANISCSRRCAGVLCSTQTYDNCDLVIYCCRCEKCKSGFHEKCLQRDLVCTAGALKNE